MGSYRPKDKTYMRARREGYRSRAALKLAELDSRRAILKPGQVVVDLGCWPGGWLQVAAEKVGPAGRVVGVDIKALAPLGLANVTTLVGDLTGGETLGRLRAAVGGKADLVLSDMAPKLSGIAVTDRTRHLALVEVAAAVAAELLDRGGVMLVKLFTAVESDATRFLKARFAEVSKTRPATTRKGSSEIYALATGLRENDERPPREVEVGQ